MTGNQCAACIYILLNEMFIDCTEELTEYIMINHDPCSSVPDGQMKWTTNSTKLFLDLYKAKRDKVGTFQTKSIKIMWRQIAAQLGELLGTTISDSQCENRWRVLERGYKKFIENQTSTGRGKKNFEYKEEMDSILGKKKNVFPEILLDSSTVDVPSPSAAEDSLLENTSSSGEVNKENVTSPEQSTTRTAQKRLRKRRTTLLEGLNTARSKYYEERINVEKEKVAQMKLRNELIKERNEILKEKRCNCV